MPAVSEAQRRYLYAHKGPAWMKAHHMDNIGALPARVNHGAKKYETHLRKHLAKKHPRTA